jgi:hypothetical protein
MTSEFLNPTAFRVTGEGAMPQGLAVGTAVPPQVNWAVACIVVLVAEHLFALAAPPYGLGVPQLFHLSFGGLYAWLAVMVHAGKGWALILLTALLATQSIGRVPVYATEDRRLRPATQGRAGGGLCRHAHRGGAAVAAAVLPRVLLRLAPLLATFALLGRRLPSLPAQPAPFHPMAAPISPSNLPEHC